ncbi:uncharacterized, partial [Tachysurus ichikawai]
AAPPRLSNTTPTHHFLLQIAHSDEAPNVEPITSLSSNATS